MHAGKDEISRLFPLRRCKRFLKCQNIAHLLDCRLGELLSGEREGRKEGEAYKEY
jgi:hypothetical protein